MAEMTKATIVASCMANGGYAAPHLNDQLYLHCKGFIKIENLEPYASTKVLWLEQNAINNLSGLEQQQELVSLFLQNNTIRSLRSLVTPLRNLRVLNVSHNYISSLKGLGAACPMLETLQASHNRIASLEVCEDLFQLAATLTSIDVSFNRIATQEAIPDDDAAEQQTVAPESSVGVAAVSTTPMVDDDVRVVELADDGDDAVAAEGTVAVLQRQGEQLEAATKADPLVLVNFFAKLPNVSVVYMHGNPISHGLRQYRRNMILHLPHLMYLDERPIFPEERRVVEAWARGGTAAETAERAAIREEKKDHLNSSVRVLTDKMEASRELRDRLTRQWDAKRAEEMEQLTQMRRAQRDARAAAESTEAARREAVERDEEVARWDAEEACAEEHAPLSAAEGRHRRDYEQALAVQAVTEEALREIAAEEEAAAARAGAAPVADIFHALSGNRLSSDTLEQVNGKDAILAELMKSDDDILREMEDEIENVLNSLEPSFYVEQQRRASRSLGSGLVSIGQLNAHPAAAAAALPTNQEEDGPATTSTQLKAVPHDRTAAKMERAVHAAVGQVALKLREDRTNAPAAGKSDVWSLLDQWELRQASN